MWILLSLLSVAVSTLYGLLLKHILSTVNPFDMTLYALPAYLLVAFMVFVYRSAKFSLNISWTTWTKILLLTLIGSANLYIMRFAQADAQNPGYPIAIASTSIVPLTLLSSVFLNKAMNYCSVFGVVLTMLGTSLIAITK